MWDMARLFVEYAGDIFIDEGAYAIMRWAMMYAQTHGVTIRTFRHYDVEALETALKSHTSGTKMPVVVCDGFCPECGQVAPLQSFLLSLRKKGGWLLIDDTQAMGILGEAHTAKAPYGFGGGGSLKWQNINDPFVVSVFSCAKAFGAPVAAICGSNHFIEKIDSASLTRVHCSPVSMASIRAVQNALHINHKEGNMLRTRLLKNVHCFRQTLLHTGIRARGGLFPVQSLMLPDRSSAHLLWKLLSNNGVRSVMLQRTNNRAALCFLLSSQFEESDIERAARLIAMLWHKIINNNTLTCFTRSVPARQVRSIEQGVRAYTFGERS